ncbi:MAG: MFS transporter [Clostridiales bacterium]|nr:MFS transporter [Clostridiales bacterium]
MSKKIFVFLQVLTGLLGLVFTYVIVKMVWNKGTVLIVTGLIVGAMAAVELSVLPKIIRGRKDEGPFGGEAVNGIIKFMTFFTYIAAYAVIPYGAVLIKYDGEKFFGLSTNFLSSLPASLLCIGIFAALLMGQKVKNLLGIRIYVILTGFCGVLAMVLTFYRLKTPYILLSSILIGVCLGFERWLMNYLVAAAAEDESDTKVKYGLYNCGLLTGLTLGGSLGGIISYVRGYRYVYFAGGLILAVVYGVSFLVMPCAYIKKREGLRALKKEIKSFLPFLKELVKRPKLVMEILTTAVPLNMGLMFIVSFLHILITMKGLNSTVNTYSYLLYGFMGNYAGIYLVKKLKNLKDNVSGFIALFIIFSGIAVLIPKVTLGGILICGALAGLFDGYGGAVLTALPANSVNAKGIDKGVMLNGLAIAGSIVSTLAPIIYGGLLNLGSLQFNLIIAAAFFGFSGLWILIKR